jgi:hypothetical protein
VVRVHCTASNITDSTGVRVVVVVSSALGKRSLGSINVGVVLLLWSLFCCICSIQRLIRSNDLTDYERLLIVRCRLNCDDAKARQLVKAIVKRELHGSYVNSRGYRWGTTTYFSSNFYNN